MRCHQGAWDSLLSHRCKISSGTCCKHCLNSHMCGQSYDAMVSQESTITAAPTPAAGKGGKADPKAAKPPSAKGGKKPDPKAAAAEAEPARPLVLLPRGARANAGRSVRSLAEAVLSMVDQLRAGAPLYTGVVPLLAGGGDGRDAGGREDDDAASYVTSAFSFGSDLQVGRCGVRAVGSLDWMDG